MYMQNLITKRHDNR